VRLFERPAPRALALMAWGTVLVMTAEAATSQQGAVRDRLEVLARHLEAAVARVSPSAQILTGQVDPTQALHVAGVGVVFVLPSRALPQPRRPASVRGRSRQQQQGAQSVPMAADPGPPRVGTLSISPTPEPPALRAAQPAQGVRGLAQLERELERELAVHTQLMRELSRVRLQGDPYMQRALELQMLAVHEQADVFRIDVERARQQAELDVRNQLGALSRPRPQVSPQVAGDAGQPGGPAVGEPPWASWLGTVAPATGQASEVLVRQVQEAIVAALEAHGAELGGLDREEFVTVAVDFVGTGTMGLHTRVRCTLLLRVPAGDVAARAAGRLTSAEFRQRVLARQY